MTMGLVEIRKNPSIRHAIRNRRIAKGMALLDEERPGWRNEVDLDNLDMYRGDRCILGQVYGGYSIGLEALGLDNGIDNGFIEPTSSWIEALS